MAVVLEEVAAAAARVPRPASAAPALRARRHRQHDLPLRHVLRRPPLVRQAGLAPVLLLAPVREQPLDLAQEQPLLGLAQVDPPRERVPAAINSAAS